jgi:hypothetical protein
MWAANWATSNSGTIREIENRNEHKNKIKRSGLYPEKLQINY